MHVLVVGENRQTAASHCQALQAAGFRTDLVAPTSSNPGCHAEPVEPSPTRRGSSQPSQSYAAVVILCDSGAVGRARSPTAPSGPTAPSCSGHCPLQQFRALGNQLPVLVIAAHASMEAQVNCLEAGADDYLAAPYEPSVLRARLRALIRRSRQTDDPVLQVGDLRLDRRTRTVRRAGQQNKLSPREALLLAFLMRHAGKECSREDIRAQAWGYEFDPGTNVVDLSINHLREKMDTGFETRMIETVRGVGYRLSAEG